VNESTADRLGRVELRLADMSIEELQLTALQAIDAAHHAAAEVAEAKAFYEGALGEFARLSAENSELRELLDDLDSDMTVVRRVWHTTQRAARPLRREQRKP